MAKLTDSLIKGHLTVIDGAVSSSLAGASTSTIGTVKLNDATDSTSTTEAATANAVRRAYELAAGNHGNHVPQTQTANDAIYLRNDNTWQVITPSKIGAADRVHQHERLQSRTVIEYGHDSLEHHVRAGLGGTGLAGSAPENPSDDWYHHLLLNHANGIGYYVDIFACFHNDTIGFRRMVGGTPTGFNFIYHTGRRPTPEEIGASDKYHSHNAAVSTSDGFMSAADKAKLDGIAPGANNYTHPNDANTRHVTDSEKSTWNGKAASNHGHSNATTSAHGFMSNTDKSKLDGIASGANNYSHPNDANTRHVTDSEKSAWNGKAAGNHTHLSLTPQYTGSGGYQAPNYFGLGLRLNMMNKLPSSNGAYHDCLVLHSYISDVPTCNMLAFSKDGAGRIEYYSQNANNTSWTHKGRVYHSGDKPSPADIGAAAASHSHSYLSTSGGTLSGTTTIKTDRDHYLMQVNTSGQDMWVKALDTSGNTQVFMGTPNANYNLHLRSVTGAALLRGTYVGCRNSDDSGYVECRASKFTVNSEEKWKRNIEEVSFSALKTIGESKIYSYDKDGSKEYGLIIGRETPDELIVKGEYRDDRTLEEKKNGPETLEEGVGDEFIDLYSMTSFSWKAIQELKAENDKLKNEINEIKRHLGLS